MRLELRVVPKWPKLAWIASMETGSDGVQVLCGPMVEMGDHWLVEGVWAGDFGEAAFDETDLVFGTGIRCREKSVTFVSSGSTLDRIVFRKSPTGWQVSNSLGALLACSGLDLRDDYDYSEDLRSICRGLKDYVRFLPASVGEIGVVYFNNLVWDGRSIREAVKPDSSPPFSDFRSYRDFLDQTARRIADNARAPQRKQRVELLTTITSGYDSVAAAVIASQVGCRQAVTIRQSTSLWRGSDSGERIAAILGLHCRAYDRECRSYPHEETIWAVGGRPGVLNWTQFDYPEPLCCFFTGCHGDKVWERDDKVLSDPFLIPSIADLGIGEFRLVKGVFHCPVPFWGMRHVGRVRAIGFREEMKPWTTGRKGYDRPIARRIIEEAGVPRGTFAVRKRNTSHEAPFLWPYSPGARERFAELLRDRGYGVPSPLALGLIRRVAHAENLMHMNVLGKIGLRKRFRPWQRVSASSLVFQWANAELKELYQKGLSAGEPVSTCLLATNSGAGGPQVSAPTDQVGGDHRTVIRLKPRIVPAWPKLAWVAVFADGAETIDVYHGPMVETSADWCVEAVWAGDFRAGDFDQTDLVFGSGIRVRDNRVVFVSSGTGMDRLWYGRYAGLWYVSNSFPALLACAGLELLEDHLYPPDLQTCWAEGKHVRSVPVRGGQVTHVSFQNLIYDGRDLRPVDGPDLAPRFADFGEYHRYLQSSAAGLLENTCAPRRRHRIEPLVSVSSGYDSPAVATICCAAGCTKAVTIRQATSLWRGSDSGEAIARRLGMECRCCNRLAREYPDEVAMWAATGDPGVISWSLFEFPQPLCLLFTASAGDAVWALPQSAADTPLHVSNIIDNGSCEYRLRRGVLHCDLPYWGIRRYREIRAVSTSPEMAPWTLGTGRYDRPIPRRIVEQAGIPRGSFAVRKKYTSVSPEFVWPYSPDCRRRLAEFLRGRGIKPPSDLAVGLARRLAVLDRMFYKNILERVGIHRRFIGRLRHRGCDLLVQWACGELTGQYAAALRQLTADRPALAQEAAQQA